ncbi:hypothetical protein C8R46DRAFT_1231644 [Mycena filopes]|nr:hypothetical protein C8R46DRAFT_1231644 [Mycena filopes]
MEDLALNINNATAELSKAKQALENHKKKGREARKKTGWKRHKETLENRIADCRVLLGQSTMNPNAPTLAGSPNDPVPDGPQSRAGLPASSTNQGNQVDPQATGHNGGLKALGKQKRIPIDPALTGDQPAKRRRQDEPQHRKIVTIDAREVVTDSLNAKMVFAFTKLWAVDRSAITSADAAEVADDDYPALCNAAVDIIDHVQDVAQQQALSEADFKWDLEYDGTDISFGLLVQLQKWLVVCGLAAEDKVPVKAKKVAQKAKVYTIWENGKRITFSPAMQIAARTNASAYPGCVEEGMDLISAVLKNRSGGEKCITCDSGPRGKVMEDRPIPPAADHPYLSGCKCPLNGAALELWMIKMTASDPRIPKRGDDNISTHRLAMNPQVLKIVGGAIEAVSGHDVEGLLQPEVDRLHGTLQWGLNRLHAIAQEDGANGVTASLQHLATRLRETMNLWTQQYAQ